MIVVDSTSPRWLRELDRFIALKNLILVHGNILDQISYPVRGEEETYWTESDITLFFDRYLTGLCYEVVGFFDPVDGLRFPSPEIEKIFQQISAGKIQKAQASIQQREVQTSAERDSQSPHSENPETKLSQITPPRRGANADSGPTLDRIRICLANTSVPCAFVFNFASRLSTSPSRLSREELVLFTRLVKASLESETVMKDDRQWNNTLILICDKLNDLPPFLYLNNPRAKAISIDRPDTTDRERFINRTYQAFHGADQTLVEPPREFASQFAALTEGFTNYELNSLVSLSRREEIPIHRIQNICEFYKYGVHDSEWTKINNLESSEEFLRSCIKGQDLAISRTMDIIKRARIGLAAGSGHKNTRPKGVLFFAGPTGVGKTELAKSMAERLFGSPERCIRFDMSEYGAEHSDQRLMGAPPGYVGYEEGGQLTNAVREHPFSILLFDEIDKAHEKIFDKFLQILDDGRLTDGKGETVYFSESIIIFTSNLGIASQMEYDQGTCSHMDDSDMPSYKQMSTEVMQAIKHHFNTKLGRPEILNRFGDNFVVFDYIRPSVALDIIDMFVGQLIRSALDNQGMELVIKDGVKNKLNTMSGHYLHHGGRGIRNMVDSVLVNPLNRALFDKGIFEPRGVKIMLDSIKDNGPESPNRYELSITIG